MSTRSERLSSRQSALALFHKSPLKQQKFSQIVRLLGATEGLRCLDIGADNGVISLLLRGTGGSWKSADLDARAVEMIRDLVEDDVYSITGLKTPFEVGEFDRIVIVDFLEHIHTDAEFAAELHRIVKPGGEVIVNVPRSGKGVVGRLRILLNQTDRKHGHVRPGYTEDSLKALFEGKFEAVEVRTYSKFFSELVDAAITCALDLLRSNAGSESKGRLVDVAQVQRRKKLFLAYSLLYPFVRFLMWLDRLCFTRGHMLIAKYRHISENSE